MVTQGYGPAGNDPKYLMRAYHVSAPIGYVYWTVSVEPDMDGILGPYPSDELTDIVVLQETLPLT